MEIEKKNNTRVLFKDLNTTALAESEAEINRPQGSRNKCFEQINAGLVYPDQARRIAKIY